VAHHAVPNAVAWNQRIGQTFAIVIYFQHQSFRMSLQANSNFAGSRVFQRVVYRFLRDSVEVASQRRIRHSHRLRTLEGAADTGAARRRLGEFMQCMHQAVIFQWYRRETVRKNADFRDALSELLAEVFRLRRKRRCREFESGDEPIDC
jgi:hypothetical protein